MKKIFNAFLTLAMVITAGMSLTSCTSNDDNPSSETVSEEPDYSHLAGDTYDITYKYDAYVSPKVNSELREALLDYIDFPVDQITDNTYLVVINSLDELKQSDLVDFYLRGVTLAVANPKKYQIDALYQTQPQLGYYCDDDDIDGALLYAIDYDNNCSYIVQGSDLEPQEGGTTVISNTSDEAAGAYTPGEGANSVAGAEADKHNDIYDHISLFIEELESQEESLDEEAAAARSMTRAADNNEGSDIKKVAGMVHLWKSMSVPINVKYFRDYTFQANCAMAVGYDIYPIHVYEGEQGAGDYYFVNMTASVNNGAVYKGKSKFWTDFVWVCLRWCGAFPTQFYVESKLVDTNNDNEVAGVSFPSAGFPKPPTVIKKVDYAEEWSFGLGLGVSGGYESGGKVKHDNGIASPEQSSGWDVKAKVDMNWKWSDSKKWSVEDVDLENQSAGATAAWKIIYNNLPEYKWSEDCGFNEGNSRAYRSTTMLNGSWIWHIPDTPDDQESKPMRLRANMKTTYKILKFWSTDASLGEVVFDSQFTDYLTMPKVYTHKVAPIVLKNDYKNKFISNIMVYTKDGKEVTSKTQFQNSYPSGSEINLGDYKCSEDLIVKFKMDDKTYTYSTNPYVKAVFKNTVTLYASQDFKAEN